jgi:type II secretory ATPase GspE/PulE/Tfp pilus assembly ATPase PilB-like protein
MGLTQVHNLVRDIDRKIDANRKHIATGDLAARRARECALFRQRGEAQLIRGRLQQEAASRAVRVARAKKCPTCHGSGYAK